jgi:hypothetical protein
MPDYSRGKIYVIENSVNDIVYVGSTAQCSIEHRFDTHRYSIHRQGETSPLYRAMCELGSQNFRIHLHHEFECSNEKELVLEEYKTMHELLDLGITLYNAVIDGKMSEDSKRRISEGNKGKRAGRTFPLTQEQKQHIVDTRCGENNPGFGFGSLIIHHNIKQDTYNWLFKWSDSSSGECKRKSKAFSIKKFGEEDARFRARAVRVEVYPNYVDTAESLEKEKAAFDALSEQSAE